ncbi:polysaccharide deacetylase family protein [bacterium]|nr:polysaccharide deacetylase family protein [bacterium]MBU1652726.1 polysaccharide deacetylase family protein [bacterium]MBU1882062.1 polysaccharide deacetylase family protein [bacterium]
MTDKKQPEPTHLQPKFNGVTNILSVDIEDYYQVEGFRRRIDHTAWERYESRFHLGLEWLLQILDSKRVKATFFILGWLAEKYPDWVAEINRRGHEIGVHGWRHRRVDLLSPEEFRRDVEKTMGLLKELGVDNLLGHRAPSFSVTRQSQWAWDIIRDCGLKYDASLSAKFFPAKSEPWTSDNPGPQFTQIGNGEKLSLFPQAYLPVFDHIPFAGGGYFRLYPYWLTRWGIRRWNQKGVPVMVYVHPWEFDPDQPRLKVNLSRSFKHYVNLDMNREKFAHLLQDFQFGPCRDLL